MQSFIFADYPLIPLMIKSPSVKTPPKTADWVAELEKIPASLVGPDGDGCRWGSISGLSEYKQLKAFISNLLTQAVEDNEIDFTKRMEQVARGVRQEVIEEIVNKVTSLIKEPGDDAIILDNYTDGSNSRVSVDVHMILSYISELKREVRNKGT